jgi:3-methyl-2-oxobutanoate hydroxymethyltransferase
MGTKITAPKIVQMRQEGVRIVCLTVYDYTSALMADAAGVDLMLVGDSVGNVIQGHSTTIPVELEDIAYHVGMVRRANPNALVVADLPFGSYNISTEQAVESSILLAKAGAEAVKLEGTYTEAISAIEKAGVPVMGHVGFTPQSVHTFGGFKVQGRGDLGSNVLADALAIEAAGAFGIVLELIPAELSVEITKALKIPTIGIGAGLGCSGEVQVWHDVLGLSERQMKHTKFFAEGRTTFVSALQQYAAEVRSGAFPTSEQSF